MGGTRFIGKSLIKKLLEQNHQITVFTRGQNPVPKGVLHLKGDRKSKQSLDQLTGKKYEVIIDSSGRELDDTRNVISITGKPSHRFIYISSAGVYENNGIFPLNEKSPIDLKSRHIGKAHTENWLKEEKIPFTSFRPTYIYGPGNYNPIESWFFDRIINSKIIPMPSEGKTITQLGHVSDLTDAMVISLNKDIAINKIYNCSGSSGITLESLIYLCAKVCKKDMSQVNIRSFNPMELDPKSRKIFPVRLSHFLTNTNLIEKELDWKPKFNLLEGLNDSYINDYCLRENYKPNFPEEAMKIFA